MSVPANPAPRRPHPEPGSRWTVKSNGNTYEVLFKDPPFDYRLQLVTLGPKADLQFEVGQHITVERDWFDLRARRAG